MSHWQSCANTFDFINRHKAEVKGQSILSANEIQLQHIKEREGEGGRESEWVRGLSGERSEKQERLQSEQHWAAPASLLQKRCWNSRTCEAERAGRGRDRTDFGAERWHRMDFGWELQGGERETKLCILMRKACWLWACRLDLGESALCEGLHENTLPSDRTSCREVFFCVCFKGCVFFAWTETSHRRDCSPEKSFSLS